MISTGYWAALGLGGWVFANGGPAASYWVPAIALAAALPLVATIADTPADVRCVSLVEAPPQRMAELEDASSASLVSGSSAARLPFRSAVRKLLAEPKIRATMLSLFGTGWVREGFLSWFGSYFQAVAGIEVGSTAHSAAAMAITLGGMVGALALGFLSDRCCRSSRPPVVLGSAVCQLVILALFPLAVRGSSGPESAATAAVVLCGLLSVPLFGALTLLMAAASVELAEPALSGTASGLLNGAQYAGSGLSALVGGFAVELMGWDALFAQLALGAVASIVGMVRVLCLQRAGRRAPAARPRDEALSVVTRQEEEVEDASVERT